MSRSEHPPSTKRRRVAAVVVVALAASIASGPNVSAQPQDRDHAATPAPVSATALTVTHEPSVWFLPWQETTSAAVQGPDPALAAEVERMLGTARMYEAERIERWVTAVQAHEEAKRLEAERIERWVAAVKANEERRAAEQAAAEKAAAERRAAEQAAARNRAAAAGHTRSGAAAGGGWAALRNCESGGNYGAVSGSGRYRGAYQFSRTTWDSVAARHYPHLVGVDPAAAAPADQDAMAQALYEMAGAGQWPHCGRHLR